MAGYQLLLVLFSLDLIRAITVDGLDDPEVIPTPAPRSPTDVTWPSPPMSPRPASTIPAHICAELNNLINQVESASKPNCENCDQNCFKAYFPQMEIDVSGTRVYLPTVKFSVVTNLVKNNAGTSVLLESLFNKDLFQGVRNIIIDAPPSRISAGKFPQTISSGIQKNLLVLNLTALGLDGYLPDYISQMSSLKILSIPFSSLAGTVPNLDMTSLTALNLRSNDLSGTLPQLPSTIQRVILASNNFYGTIADYIYNKTQLPNLKILLLDFNFLSGTIKLFEQPMTHILMASNRFDAIDNKNFEISTLKYLHLDRNSLKATSLQVTIGSSLLSLKLQNNILSGRLAITGGCSLVELSVKSNLFRGSLPALTGCSYLNMTMMDFSDNRFAGFVNYYLSDAFPNLMDLNLGENIIANLSPPDKSKTHRCMTDPCTFKLSGNRIGALLVDGLSAQLHAAGLLNRFLTTYELSPQDVDECEQKPQPEMPLYAVCSDGWDPKHSFTWKCGTGYEIAASNSSEVGRCVPDCGDGLLVVSEFCDTKLSDGCAAGCTESKEGWKCSNTILPINDGLFIPTNNKTKTEACFDGSTTHINALCLGGCATLCGDGKLLGEEQCDDGNKIDGDGCTNCLIDAGWKFETLIGGLVSLPTVCRDINQCELDEYTTDVTQKCGSSTRCLNLIGSELFGCCPPGQTPTRMDYGGECVPCIERWEPQSWNVFVTYPNLERYLAGIGLSLTQQPVKFISCVGSCNMGQRMSLRNIRRPGCFDTEGEETFKTELCGFPCSNLTSATPTESVYRFVEEVSRDGFLEDIVLQLFNTNITIEFLNGTQKRAGEVPDLRITLDDCSHAQEITGAITALATDILPGAIQQLVWKNLTQACRYEMTYAAPGPGVSSLLLGMIGLAFQRLTFWLAVVLVVLIIISIFLYLRMKKSVLVHLPEQVAWSYQLCENALSSWKKRGTDEMCYYFQELNGSEFHRARAIFDGYLGGAAFGVSTITAVYNPTLVTNFVNTFLIYQKRFDEDKKTYFRETWGAGADTEKEARKSVIDAYSAKVLSHPWNKDVPVGIIPSIHGTDQFVAEKIVVASREICETGFAALSSLDAGFYGKGIYFSTATIYTLPYFGTRKNPAVIVSWLLPGNVYPVIEHRQQANGLVGAAIKAGYNSHYAHVTNRGDIPELGTKYNPHETELTKMVFDEIVIAQENQICPAFIVAFNPDSLSILMNQFARSSMQPATAPTMGLATEGSSLPPEGLWVNLAN